MQDSSPHSVTALLHGVQQGNPQAFDDLFALVYDELRRLARVVRQGRASETLNTTALVHEVYAKLIPAKDLHWHDRSHFFRIAARAMRQILVSTARRRLAEKRGGGALTVAFDEHVHQDPVRADELVALDEALTRLETLDPRQAQIVECRFFAGLNVAETAQALGISPMTVPAEQCADAFAT